MSEGLLVRGRVFIDKYGVERYVPDEVVEQIRADERRKVVREIVAELRSEANKQRGWHSQRTGDLVFIADHIEATFTPPTEADEDLD